MSHDPASLASHYSHFRVSERLLFTGHSHQAWPDVGLAAQQQAWMDAADHVDQKWGRAFEEADRVRAGYRRLLQDADGHMALGINTHELVLRFLSALPLRQRPRLVTTDGEFHSIRRQVDRLAEEGFEIVKVPSEPAADLAVRLAEAVDDRTAAVLVSSVLFRTAQIVPHLGLVAAAAEDAGAELLVDTYHHLAVVPFSVADMGLERAFIVGGGYKYCQLGEGNCFLRFPKDCGLRPVITGWFAEFDAIHGPAHEVAYAKGDGRFAGATYDPTSHYRGAAVFEFFEQEGLDAKTLRGISQAQVDRLITRFDGLDLNPALVTRSRDVPLKDLAGFLALKSPRAHELSVALRALGVATDAREDSLRFGPAPYITDSQIDDAMGLLKEVVLGL